MLCDLRASYMSLDLKVLLVFPYRYSSSFLVRESFPAHRGAELAFLAVPALLVALLSASCIPPSFQQTAVVAEPAVAAGERRID